MIGASSLMRVSWSCTGGRVTGGEGLDAARAREAARSRIGRASVAGGSRAHQKSKQRRARRPPGCVTVWREAQHVRDMHTMRAACQSRAADHDYLVLYLSLPCQALDDCARRTLGAHPCPRPPAIAHSSGGVALLSEVKYWWWHRIPRATTPRTPTQTRRPPRYTPSSRPVRRISGSARLCSHCMLPCIRSLVYLTLRGWLATRPAPRPARLRAQVPQSTQWTCRTREAETADRKPTELPWWCREEQQYALADPTPCHSRQLGGGHSCTPWPDHGRGGGVRGGHDVKSLEGQTTCPTHRDRYRPTSPSD